MTAVTPTIVVHGGAGNPRDSLGDEAGHHAGLREALEAGFGVLTGGGAALDAAEVAVRSLEDCPLFNAGRGSVLTSDGAVEMDAAIMDGARRRAGACAHITRVRHPITLARRIMEATRHVLIVGADAEELARAHGLELESPDWFVTVRERARFAEVAADGEHGTVGAVALDARGNLAAATSTGGVRGQLPGRVGDTPQIGAGTYADEHVAVSCTGTGEQFIQAVAAHELAALVRLGSLPLEQAAARALADLDGGLIALDRTGSLSMPFNTRLMYRGWIAGGDTRTAIWHEEDASG